MNISASFKLVAKSPKIIFFIVISAFIPTFWAVAVWQRYDVGMAPMWIFISLFKIWPIAMPLIIPLDFPFFNNVMSHWILTQFIGQKSILIFFSVMATYLCNNAIDKNPILVTRAFFSTLIRVPLIILSALCLVFTFVLDPLFLLLPTAIAFNPAYDLVATIKNTLKAEYRFWDRYINGLLAYVFLLLGTSIIFWIGVFFVPSSWRVIFVGSGLQSVVNAFAQKPLLAIISVLYHWIFFIIVFFILTGCIAYFTSMYRDYKTLSK